MHPRIRTGIAVAAGVSLLALASCDSDPMTAPDPTRGAAASPSGPRPSPGEGSPPKDLQGARSPNPPPDARTLLAWTPGSLPAGTEAALEWMPQVEHATTVYAGLDWIRSLDGGAGVEDPPQGFRFPFEIAAVEPAEYARFARPDEREAIRDLGTGELLFAETERDLRGAGAGLKVNLGERRLDVSGVISDASANGYEALMAGPPPPEWVRADRFVLVRLRGPQDRPVVERAIRSLPGSAPLQTRTAGAKPFLRYGDSSLAQLIAKDVFGEFAARPGPAGTIEVDRTWKRRSIANARLPLLGKVRCHRRLIPQLRAALREVRRRGLGREIRQYSGCYYPRFIGSDPDGRLSHHSWGMAIDINAAENRFGVEPTMDRRVVRIFEQHGFTWGGRWIVPDGMHFEWWQPAP